MFVPILSLNTDNKKAVPQIDTAGTAFFVYHTQVCRSLGPSDTYAAKGGRHRYYQATY